jgi:hypothetical protein
VQLQDQINSLQAALESKDQEFAASNEAAARNQVEQWQSKMDALEAAVAEKEQSAAKLVTEVNTKVAAMQLEMDALRDTIVQKDAMLARQVSEAERFRQAMQMEVDTLTECLEEANLKIQELRAEKVALRKQLAAQLQVSSSSPSRRSMACQTSFDDCSTLRRDTNNDLAAVATAKEEDENDVNAATSIATEILANTKPVVAQTTESKTQSCSFQRGVLGEEECASDAAVGAGAAVIEENNASTSMEPLASKQSATVKTGVALFDHDDERGAGGFDTFEIGDDPVVDDDNSAHSLFDDVSHKSMIERLLQSPIAKSDFGKPTAYEDVKNDNGRQRDQQQQRHDEELRRLKRDHEQQLRACRAKSDSVVKRVVYNATTEISARTLSFRHELQADYEARMTALEQKHDAALTEVRATLDG